MTQIIIIAREKDFVIIGDTRNSMPNPNNPPYKMYHDQEQKIFVSSHHRIGIGISEDATLTNSKNPNDHLRVSYLMTRFIDYLDKTKNNVTIFFENFFLVLDDFVKVYYPNYLASYLKYGVDLFCGGFDVKGHTMIHSRVKGNIQSFVYSDSKSIETGFCAFSNSGILGKDSIRFCVEKIFSDPLYAGFLGGPFAGMTGKNDLKTFNKYLGFPQHDKILQGVIPLIRFWVTKDAKTETDIGLTFDCYIVNERNNVVPLLRENYSIQGQSTSNNQSGSLVLIPSGSLNYTKAKTVLELEGEMQSGATIFFDESGTQIVNNNGNNNNNNQGGKP